MCSDALTLDIPAPPLALSLSSHCDGSKSLYRICCAHRRVAACHGARTRPGLATFGEPGAVPKQRFCLQARTFDATPQSAASIVNRIPFVGPRKLGFKVQSRLPLSFTIQAASCCFSCGYLGNAFAL